MKTNRKTSQNEPISPFLNKLIGSRAGNAVKKLLAVRVETAGLLAGKFQSWFPKLTRAEANKRCVAPSFLEIQEKRQPDDSQKRLQRFLGLSSRDIVLIADACKELQEGHQLFHHDPGWSFGAIKRGTVKAGQQALNHRSVRIASGFYVIPRYQDAGPVFDQGNRGTCVANAVCALLDYRMDFENSRQLLYHQCKHVDGMKHLEGTTIEAPFTVMTKQSLVDIGNVQESIWRYNPHIGRTVHQGPPPEKAYHTQRIFSDIPAVFIGQIDKVQDIKILLNLNVNGKTCPVVIGVPLYESFFGLSTHETGWVTLPIPGEAIVGYHAMIVVGYDDDRQLFLVRNSWGPHWADQNDRGYKGHAWIPYDYISRYCFSGATLTELNIKTMFIPENKRLYFNKTIGFRKDRAAAMNKGEMSVFRGKGRRISFAGWLLRIAVAVLLWYAYREPILNFKDRVVTYIQDNVDLQALRKNAEEAIEKLNP